MSDQTPKPPKPRPPSSIRDLASQMGEPMSWLRSEIDRLFEDFGRPARSVLNLGPRGMFAPAPALEMVDDEKAYRLTAELPGLQDQDVDISIAEGMLRISGEKKEQEERRDRNFLISERRYGSFQREIPLPPDVDPDKITAQFKDGVLTITLAKDEKAAARTRKIAIQKT